MRKELKPFLDKKLTFNGVVERYGLKSQYVGGNTPTMLLKDVELNNGENKIVIEHLWVNVGKTIYQKNIKEGSVISFNGWVKPYKKGYINPRESKHFKSSDIGVNRISAIKIVKEGNGKSFSNFWTTLPTTKFLSNKIEMC